VRRFSSPVIFTFSDRRGALYLSVFKLRCTEPISIPAPAHRELDFLDRFSRVFLLLGRFTHLCWHQAHTLLPLSLFYGLFLPATFLFFSLWFIAADRGLPTFSGARSPLVPRAGKYHSPLHLNFLYDDKPVIRCPRLTSNNPRFFSGHRNARRDRFFCGLVVFPPVSIFVHHRDTPFFASDLFLLRAGSKLCVLYRLLNSRRPFFCDQGIECLDRRKPWIIVLSLFSFLWDLSSGMDFPLFFPRTNSGIGSGRFFRRLGQSALPEVFLPEALLLFAFFPRLPSILNSWYRFLLS